MGSAYSSHPLGCRSRESSIKTGLLLSDRHRQSRVSTPPFLPTPESRCRFILRRASTVITICSSISHPFVGHSIRSSKTGSNRRFTPSTDRNPNLIFTFVSRSNPFFGPPFRTYSPLCIIDSYSRLRNKPSHNYRNVT